MLEVSFTGLMPKTGQGWFLLEALRRESLFLSPCEVAQSRALGIRTWRSLGAHYSPDICMTPICNPCNRPRIGAGGVILS